MATIGTPLSASSTRVMLLGSGELGKEVAIELQRLGCEVIAIDRYENAPAMQIAHRFHVIDMRDEDQLRQVVQLENPHYIVPEIEAIATSVLPEFEDQGTTVVPTALAANLTMNRRGIRELVSNELGIQTSPFEFVETKTEFENAVERIGLPCVVKPVMSSSGKGQSTIKSNEDIAKAWEYAHSGARGGAEAVIVEGFVPFTYEITLLTISHVGGISFCEPIGHRQVKGDYRESWQPHPMQGHVLEKCQDIATQVCDALGGFGLFGMEFFIEGDDVYFSEVSPRPHDTGMVTLISQNLSEFALHARAILGLPIPRIELLEPSASRPIVVEGETDQLTFGNLEAVLSRPKTDIRLFGKPEIQGTRRCGVALARRETIEGARQICAEMLEDLQLFPEELVEQHMPE